MAFPNQGEISVSGADNFQLLLDRHMKQNGQPGNIVRLELRFGNEVNLEKMKSGLESSKATKLVNQIKLKPKSWGVGKWSITEMAHQTKIQIHRNANTRYFHSNILNRKVNLDESAIAIDLLEMENREKKMVISAHHALFDQRGMINLLYALSKNKIDYEKLWPIPKPVSAWKQVKSSFQISAKLLFPPSWKLASLSKEKGNSENAAIYHELNFSKEETSQIEINAKSNGALLGNTPFYLAASCLAVQSILQLRSEDPSYYWLPIPQNSRPKGEQGHLFSNDLSFMFFKLKKAEFGSLTQATRTIVQQFKQQVRQNIPGRYSELLRLFRNLPISLFLNMVKLPTAGAISSFSFSDLGQNRNEMKKFMGQELTDMVNYPPVPNPPGLVTVFMKYNHRLKVLIGYHSAALEEEELLNLTKYLRNNLFDTTKQ